MYDSIDKQSNNLAKAVEMALKDILTTPVKHRPASWYDTIQTSLSKEDLQWLNECIDNVQQFSGVYIAEKLTQAGYPVSASTINNIRKHRRG